MAEENVAVQDETEFQPGEADGGMFGDGPPAKKAKHFWPSAKRLIGLLAPEHIEVPVGWALAGNADAAYPGRIAPAVPAAARVVVLPTASALLRLAPALLAAGQAVPADQALPRYIRDKVAKTTQERADERLAQATAGLA